MFDFLDFANRQNSFDAEINPFDCLRKKLAGKSSISLDQWIDIFLLALAGARQSGATDSEIAMMLELQSVRNQKSSWRSIEGTVTYGERYSTPICTYTWHSPFSYPADARETKYR